MGTTSPVIGSRFDAACSCANRAKGVIAAAAVAAAPVVMNLRLLSIGASGPKVDRCAALGQLEDEVRRHEADRAGDEDLEIGGTVGVDVALDPGVGAVEEITQLAAGARESGGAD